jgi:hypothetical protein
MRPSPSDKGKVQEHLAASFGKTRKHTGSGACRLAWRRRIVPGSVEDEVKLCQGISARRDAFRVWHSPEKDYLHGWHRVVMSTEGQSKAMRNVAFLD